MNARQLAFLIAARQQQDFFKSRPVVNHLFQGSRAVRSSDVNDFIKDVISNDLYSKGLQTASSLRDFTNNFASWINLHPSSRIARLSMFEPDFSAGTTQAFDSFYFRHRNRRFRCFTGEYLYHIKTWASNKVNWEFLTDELLLSSNDAVVISAPFCDTGSMHPLYNELISKCNLMGIPVLVDCCYYTISHNINIDIYQPCIDTIAFSLSKAYPVANLRIGVRYTRKDIQDGQKLHHSINYNNNISAYVGQRIIEKFGPQHIAYTYYNKQKEICQTLDLQMSDSVIFAIGDSSWNQYNRSNLLQTYNVDLDPALFVNRICLVPILENWDLFTKLKDDNSVRI